MSDWHRSYAAYDDAALALVGNPGLVRRAAKLAPTAAWVEGAGGTGAAGGAGGMVGAGGAGGTGGVMRVPGAVRVSGFDVVLDARGPGHGRCPCPTAGVCVHVLAAAMFIRDGLDPAVDESTNESTDESTDELTDESTDAAPVVDRAAGVFAVRAPVDAGSMSAGSADAVPVASCGVGVSAVRAPVDAGSMSAGSAEAAPVASCGAGVSALGDPAVCETAVRDPAVRDPAVRAPAPARSAPAGPPAATPAGPTAATRRLTSAVRGEIERTLAVGLSHLGSDAADRLADLTLDARVGGLPLLARTLGAAAALLTGVAERRDDAPEIEALGALARAWALAGALDAAGPQTWPELRGASRRVFDETASLVLLPLGATWWVTASGARGLTLTAWDADAGQVRAATTARPVGADPGFVRSPDTTCLWGVALSRLLRGPFRVDGPRLAADGALSPTARSVTSLPGGVTEAAIHAVADQLTPGEAGVGFADSVRPVAVLPTDGFGRVTIDEPQQQLVWSLPSRGVTQVLRQEITVATAHRVDTLLAWADERVPVRYVLARRATVRGRAVWEPATVFLPAGAGQLTVAALDFQAPPRPARRGLLQQRWALVRQRWERAPAAAPSRPAIAVICDDVRDITTSLAATGRLTPSPERRRRCEGLAAVCDDVALATLAAALRRIVENPGAPAVLWAHHVADRVATLAAG